MHTTEFSAYPYTLGSVAPDVDANNVTTESLHYLTLNFCTTSCKLLEVEQTVLAVQNNQHSIEFGPHLVLNQTNSQKSKILESS